MGSHPALAVIPALPFTHDGLGDMGMHPPLPVTPAQARFHGSKRRDGSNGFASLDPRLSGDDGDVGPHPSLVVGDMRPCPPLPVIPAQAGIHGCGTLAMRADTGFTASMGPGVDRDDEWENCGAPLAGVDARVGAPMSPRICRDDRRDSGGWRAMLTGPSGE
jgi:hypothetical protein